MAYTHTTSTLYHSQGNAICERLNRTVLNMIGALSAAEKRSWQKHTNYLTYAYNTTINSSTDFSLFYLMFGRNPKLIGDCIISVNFNHACKLTADKFLVNLKKSYLICKDNIVRAQESSIVN